MMARLRQRRRRRRWAAPARLLQAPALAAGVMVASASPASADVVAYLVNVTVRPVYHFANADDAIRYAQRICDKVAQGHAYGVIIGDVKTDFNTVDEYQASYLITQAVNELCPAMIWQLRSSAAHYRPAAR